MGEHERTIKSIDEKLLVIDPLNDGKSQASFELGPDVKRTGTLTTGTPVTVRFYLENGKRVATEVTGRSDFHSLESRRAASGGGEATAWSVRGSWRHFFGAALGGSKSFARRYAAAVE